MRRRNKKLQFKTLIILFVITLLSFSVGYSILEDRLSIEGKTSFIYDAHGEDITKEAVIKHSYTMDAYNSGSGRYTRQYMFTVENISDMNFTNWIGVADLATGDTLINCWNVDCSVEKGKLKMASKTYNGVLGIGETADFGVVIEHANTTNLLSNIYFYGSENEDNNGGNSGTSGTDEPDNPETPSNLIATYKNGSSWFNGRNYTNMYDITITNNGDTQINGWEIDLRRFENYHIDTAYNANFVERDDVMRFSNVSYNGSIAPGKSVTFQVVLTNVVTGMNIVIVDVKEK